MPKVIVKKNAKAPRSLAALSAGIQIPIFKEEKKTPPPKPAASPLPYSAQPAVPVISAQEIEELHDLIMAQYDMALYERRIFLKMLQLLPETIMHPDGIALFEPILIDAREMIADTDLKGESAFLELQKATMNLIKHVCRIAESDGILQVGLMSSAKYLKGKGQIRLHIDPALHPYLLKVRNHFSLDQLQQLIKFRSYYSQCFYEWFQKASRTQQSRINRVIPISLASLREMLRIDETEYERYYDLKRFVIGQAQKELKGTEFEFSFKERRSGRKVIGLLFYLA